MLPIGLFPLYAVPIVHAGKQSMCFQLSPLSIHRTLSLLCIGMIRFAACITFFSARSCLPAVLLLEISSPALPIPTIAPSLSASSYLHLFISLSLSLSLSLFGSSSCTPANLFAGQWMRYLPSRVPLKVSVAKRGQWKLIEGINQTPAILSEYMQSRLNRAILQRLCCANVSRSFLCCHAT